MCEQKWCATQQCEQSLALGRIALTRATEISKKPAFIPPCNNDAFLCNHSSCVNAEQLLMLCDCHAFTLKPPLQDFRIIEGYQSRRLAASPFIE
eukprot:scaffold75358_cov17-Tisochrysis_lutea.AAC.1